VLIPDNNHVLRHIDINDCVTNDATGEPLVVGSAFIDEPKHGGMVSYAWREYHESQGDKYKQVDAVINEFHRGFKKTDMLAELCLKRCYALLKESGLDSSRDIYVKHDPQKPTGKYTEPFMSHALMVGVPDDESPFAEAVGDVIADALTSVYKTR